MKKIILISTLIVCNISIHSQNLEDIDRKKISIYEYGIPITSCECNFENLLNNWNKWVTNHEETMLLSYEYIEQLQDMERISHYANLMYNWNSTGFNKSGNNGVKNGTYFREFNLVPVSFSEIIENIPKEIVKDSVKMIAARHSIEEEIAGMRKNFLQNVQLGDKVYLLKFKTKTKIYDYYVVCLNENNKIVPFDFLFDIKEQWGKLKKINY